MSDKASGTVRAELAPTGVLRAGINLSNFLLVTGRTEKGEPVGVAPDNGPDPAWLRKRLERSIWRDDEIAGRVVDVRIRQKRQSRNGTTALCTVDLSGSDGRSVEQLYLLHQVPAGALQAEAEMVAAEATIVPPLGRAWEFVGA